MAAEHCQGTDLLSRPVGEENKPHDSPQQNITSISIRNKAIFAQKNTILYAEQTKIMPDSNLDLFISPFKIILVEWGHYFCETSMPF
jgi:hypothetical protein